MFACADLGDNFERVVPIFCKAVALVRFDYANHMVRNVLALFERENVRADFETFVYLAGVGRDDLAAYFVGDF